MDKFERKKVKGLFRGLKPNFIFIVKWAFCIKSKFNSFQEQEEITVKPKQPFDIRKSFFHLFLTFVILFSTLPNHIFAVEEESHLFKMDSAVLEDFKHEDYITFLVKMKEQVDLEEVKEKLQPLHLLADATESTPEAAIRGLMVEELQSTSHQTQKRIIQYLEAEKESGQVKEYESFFIINSLSVTATRQVAEMLARLPEVEKIIENKSYQPEIDIPSEEEENDLSPEVFVDNPFAVHSTAADKLELPWNLKNIHIEKVWEQNYQGEGVVVAIIDSGADLEHPAIKDAWRGNEEGMAVFSWMDATSYSKKTTPVDKDGHGTHVLGTILGKQSDNGMALGVAPKAKWVAVKVLDDEGTFTTAGLLRAGQWILAPTDEDGTPHPEKAPSIVNNSWGSFDSNEFYRDILKKWREAGIFPVFSAGNTRYNLPNRFGTVSAPAKYPEAFAVGALDIHNIIAPFSLLGPSSYNETKPEISAPGVNIKSSVPGGFALMSGTSMASPHVTGVAAILKQVNPNLTVDELEKILMASADARTDEKYVDVPNNAYGHGSLNALRAVEMAKQGSAESFGTLKGRILTQGQNNTVPGINHPPLTTLFKGFNFDYTVEVNDEEGISEVNFYMKKESDAEFQKYPMKLTAGTKLSGTYLVEIDPDTLVDAGQNMKYYISALDVAGKEKRTDEITAVVSNGIGIGYHQDFESYPEGFVFTGKTPLWQWGKPESGPESAVSGEKVVATNLKGKYKGLEEAILVTPVIDLTDKTAPATLTFQHWYDMDSTLSTFHDTAEIWIGEVKPGDKNAERPDLKLYRSYRGAQKEWTYEYIDLSGYKGKRIFVMFGVRYGGWSKQNKAGWYIDDIKIEKPSEEVPQTPYEYLSGRYSNEGSYRLTFYKLNNPKVTDYVLYRSSGSDKNFEPVQTVTAGEISYKSVNFSDYPKPQVGDYYYYATARIGENESKPTPIFKHTFTEGSRVQFFDFEESDQGWKSYPAEGADSSIVWTRGIVDETKSVLGYQTGNAMPTKGTSKGKNEGATVWGTELMNFRKPESKYILESPSMDLSKIKQGRMYFQTWFNTFGRRGWVEQYGDVNFFTDDWGYIYISKDDGETWHELFALKDENNKGFGKHRIRSAWYLDHLDIPAEYLSDKFKVKFVLDAYKDTTGAGCGGWYMDDFAIYDLEQKEPGTDATAVELAEESTEFVESVESSEATENISAEVLPFEIENFRLFGADASASTEIVHIPVVGQVISQNNGLAVTSELGSGSYAMKHVAGTHTFRVEALGYKPVEYTLNIVSGQETVQDFVLEPQIGKTLTFKVVDTKNKGLSEVTATLVHNGNPTALSSDAAGLVTFRNLFAGTYQLVLKKNGYQLLQKEVILDDRDAINLDDIKMTEIVVSDQESELAFDSGNTKDHYFGVKDGTTTAIRFHTDKPAVLKKARFYLVAEKDNAIQGKDFSYSIYGKMQKDGFAGERIAGPFTGQSQNAGEWTEVSFPQEVLVNGDFYIAYTQIGDKETAPLLGFDKTASKVNSFYLSANAWHLVSTEGSFMIRATISEYTEKKEEPQTPIVPAPSPSPSPSPAPSPAPTPKADKDTKTKDVILENEKLPLSSGKDALSAKFTDITGHWAKAEITELVNKGLLRGTSAGNFSPNQKTNRAMLFTILYRLNGEEAETTGKLWYEDGLQYVVKQGISDGTNPLSLITREQLITMLHRYADKPKGNADLTSFVDEASIQDYAKEAMLWAVEKGILVGNPDKKLQPQKNATRAEVAVILSRFMKMNRK